MDFSNVVDQEDTTDVDGDVVGDGEQMALPPIVSDVSHYCNQVIFLP